MKNKLVICALALLFFFGYLTKAFVNSHKSNEVITLEHNAGCYTTNLPDMSGRVLGSMMVRGEQYIIMDSKGKVILCRHESPEPIPTNAVMVVLKDNTTIYSLDR